MARMKRMVAKVAGALRSNFTVKGAAKAGMKKVIKAGRKSGSRASSSAVYNAAKKGMKRAKINQIAAGTAAGGAVAAGIGRAMYTKKKDGSKSKSMGRKSK